MLELVHAYSNLVPQSKTLCQVQIKAASTTRKRDSRPRRQGQRRLGEAEVVELIVAYGQQKSIKELAAKYRIHRVTVTSLLRRSGVELRQVGLTDVQAAEACRLYPEGWSLGRLAKRYDVNDMTVRRYLLLAEVVMRLPHQRPKGPIES
jgi:hypothetical protein